MTGQINVNKIAARSGNTVTVASGDVLYAPGHVVQVKYFQLTTSQTETYSSANADQAISNFTVNRTPRHIRRFMK